MINELRRIRRATINYRNRIVRITIKDRIRYSTVDSIPRRNIFFMNIFLSRRTSYHTSPLLSNQFQYPRQDQMTLNILL